MKLSPAQQKAFDAIKAVERGERVENGELCQADKTVNAKLLAETRTLRALIAKGVIKVMSTDDHTYSYKKHGFYYTGFYQVWWVKSV